MIRVLHYGLSPNRGGIETYLDKLWTHIDKTQFHFDFVDEWAGQACFREKFEEMGSAFYDVTPRRKSIGRNWKLWDELLSERRFDIVHCHLNTLSYVTPVYAAIRHGVPVIVHSRSSGVSLSPITKVLHTFNRVMLTRNNIVRLAVSCVAGKWLFGKEAKFTVINNGIDLAHFSFSAHQRNRVRSDLGIPQTAYVVGAVGSLVEVKNHKFLVSVFNDLKAACKDAIMLIAGEGRQREALAAQIAELGLADSVYLLGNRGDVPDILSAMDVFVMPSLFEGFANAALEAQTSGLPCILSDTITREVGISNCCYLALSAASEAWVKAILNANIRQPREFAWKLIEAAGLSAAEEADTIRNIYHDTLSKTTKTRMKQDDV